MTAEQLIRQAQARGLDLPHVGVWEGSDRSRALLDALDQALGVLDTVVHGMEAHRYEGTVLHVRAVVARLRVAHRPLREV